MNNKLDKNITIPENILNDDEFEESFKNSGPPISFNIEYYDNGDFHRCYYEFKYGDKFYCDKYKNELDSYINEINKFI